MFLLYQRTDKNYMHFYANSGVRNLSNELLANVEGVTAPPGAADRRYVYHVCAVLVDNREASCQALIDAEVQYGMHYPIPVHLNKAFDDLGYKAGDFPVAERVANEGLSLPMLPELTGEQIWMACRVLGKRDWE